ncbi:tRNA lysidine(34) synthetase TilS [Legionella taurinensis]|uniref:tRNA lysidine(34) synthetase TilS n=1 Tax=Legionella taurinensis TaxID=70611 RepID=UPI00351A1D57
MPVTDKTRAPDWLRDLAAYEHLFVGFSGGLDSTVLLHLLSQHPAFIKKVTAVHINHGLSRNASLWQEHCERLCEQWQVNFIALTVRCDHRANVEEAARVARYQALGALIKKNNCLLMGHHLDDQAETLLLHLFRGAGVDGLTAIPEKSTVGEGDLRRPLLSCTRQSLQAYALEHRLRFIDDESNANTRFSRNFLRQDIFPLLKGRWPGVTRNLARTAEHCRLAQANLTDLAHLDCPSLAEKSRVLPLLPLLRLNRARLGNVLRTWLRQHDVRMPNTLTFNRLMDEMIQAAPDSNPEIHWQQVTIKRYQHHLYLSPSRPECTSPLPWTTFPNTLCLQGMGKLTAETADEGLFIPSGSQLAIRFREGGDTFYWHGQNKSLKKLFQEWKIPPWQRQQIPLLYVDNQLAAVIGYAVSDLFYQRRAGRCYKLSHIINQ